MISYRLLAPFILLVNFAAFSQSTNYQLSNYGVNGGGSTSTGSTTYKANVGAGEISGGATGATTYTTKSGSIEAQQANVPGAPTLDNGSGTYYNKLKFTLNTSGNASDTLYSVAIATNSGFTGTSYVQADGTLGASPVYLSYTNWGGSGGFFAIGLTSSTTYWFKADAVQGLFTASAYGPSANLATASPALSFSVSPSLESMGNLTAGSVITSPSNLSFTFSTNAASGGNIYMLGSDTGLHSIRTGYTIQVSPPSGDLGSLGEGFGLQGISASSPLAISSPYNGSGSTVGAIYTTFQPVFSAASPVTGGTATAALKAKATATTPAASDYTVTLTFVAAASY